MWLVDVKHGICLPVIDPKSDSNAKMSEKELNVFINSRRCSILEIENYKIEVEN